MAKELKRTKNSIVMQGIIGNLEPNDKGNGFSSGVRNGVPWKKVKLSLKTANGNMVFAELYGSVRKEAVFYNRATGKSKKIPWAQRFTYNESGFKLMQTDYDLVDEMERVLQAGMSVKMWFSYAGENYVNKDGIPVKRNYLKITKFEPIDDLNLDDPKYEELNYVNMEVIMKQVTTAPDGNLIVDGFIVDSFNKPQEIQLIAENADEMFGLKNLRYGTKITVVNGKYRNMISGETIEVPNKAGFGKSTIKKHKDNRKVGIFIDTVDSSEIIDGLYSPEDIAAASEGVKTTQNPTTTQPTYTAPVSNDDNDEADLDLEL